MYMLGFLFVPAGHAASAADVSGFPTPLAEAVTTYERGDFEAAAVQFWQLRGRYPEHAGAVAYFEGAALQELGLPQAASDDLDAVVKRGVDEPYFAQALVRLGRVADTLGDDSDLQRIASEVPLDRVPEELRDRLSWLHGLDLYQSEHLSQAVQALESVAVTSPYHVRATYVIGVIRTQQSKLKSGVRAFRDVILTPSAEPRYVDLALLNTARVYYGIEQFDTAEVYYQQVPRGDAWADAVYERAWSEFMRNDLNRTLGDLLTLKAPQLQDTVYRPKRHILEALAWFNVCHYEEADRLMRAFTATWAPVRDALGPVAAAETGAGEAYDRFFDTGAAAFPAALRNEIGKDRVVAAAVAHRAAIRDERARLTTMRPAFLASIGVDVGHALDAADAEAHRRAGAAVAGRLHEEEAALGELLSQAAIIRFEIVDADRQRYWDPVLVTARFEQRGQFFWREPAARNYWAFNGEFWEDELGTYTYDVETRCPY